MPVLTTTMPAIAGLKARCGTLRRNAFRAVTDAALEGFFLPRIHRPWGALRRARFTEPFCA